MLQTQTAQLHVRRATTLDEIAACERLTVEIYRTRYGVTFSEQVDPEQRLEPLPDHYVYGSIDGELVATAGLYTRFTYAERFGRLSEAELLAAVTAAGFPDAISRPRVEYTKLVVHPRWEGCGIGRRFLAATHSRDFLTAGSGATPLVLASGKVSIFRSLYEAVGIRTRTVKPFPLYKSHERYRTPDDPMESRIAIPEVDIDARWFQFTLPGAVQIELPAVSAPPLRAVGA